MSCYLAGSARAMRQTTLAFAAKPKANKPPPKIDPEVEKEPFNPDYEQIFDSGEAFASCLEPSWRAVLQDEFSKPYFKQLLDKLKSEKRTMYPKKADILNAFKFCPFRKVRVVIIGQDPYHEPNQAHGLAFSVQKGIAIPPSLQNIYKEIAAEYPDFQIPKHGYLESWAKQGVLLLNATLTVAAHEANSHEKFGWMKFTQAAVNAINERLRGVVFLAWGNFAKGICKNVNKSVHHVLECGHPSPLSVRYFMGCGQFKEANRLLALHDQPPIKWSSVND